MPIVIGIYRGSEDVCRGAIAGKDWASPLLLQKHWPCSSWLQSPSSSTFANMSTKKSTLWRVVTIGGLILRMFR